MKELLLAGDRGVYFTTPHFNGYPAVLVRIPDLARIDREELRDLVAEALADQSAEARRESVARGAQHVWTASAWRPPTRSRS